MHVKALPAVPEPIQVRDSTSGRSQMSQPDSDTKHSSQASISTIHQHDSTIQEISSASSAHSQSSAGSLHHKLGLRTSSRISNTNDNLTKPQRYRLNKPSSSHNSHSWQLDGEPSLAQVLEQERSAWLTESSAGTPSPDRKSLVQDAESWMAATLSEPESSYEDYDSIHIESAHNLPENDSTMVACPQSTVKSYASNETIRRTHHERSRPPKPVKRKSYFQEGSMNDTSRGVASAWDTSHVDYKGRSGRTSRAEEDDLESTPRASSTSRASTYSSIDINEFKPLPATPMTLKNTIRRFGQKLRHPEAFQPSEQPKPFTKSKRRKRGLRKSVSTWRIFNNSVAEEEEEDHGIHGTSRITYCNKTVKASSGQRGESQPNADVLHKSILDERKRKAEAIYAEQFSTSRKRQKPLDAVEDKPMQESTPTNVATIRKRRSSGFSTIRNIKSVRHRGNDDDNIPELSDCESTQTMAALPSQHTSATEKICSQTYNPVQMPNTDFDRLKKQSRSKLEKENQRLRSMLREQKSKDTVRKGQPHCQQVSYSKENPRHEQISAVVSPSNLEESDHESSGSAPVPAHTVSTLPGDVPPIPPLPLDLQASRALNTISGNLQASKDTATMKHRTPIFEGGEHAKLPRPLSTVLEGLETDSDQEKNHNMGTAKQGRAGKSHSYDGATDEENERVVRSDSKGDWQWPEDVF